MSRLLIVLLLLPATMLVAQRDPMMTPKVLPRQEGAGLPFGEMEARPGAAVDDGAVLAARLTRLEFVDGAGAVLAAGDDLVTILQATLGRPLTEGGLDRITDLILVYYEERDQPVVEVFVPEQDLVDGVLRIEVVVGRLGVVGLEKTRYFNDDLLAGSILLKQGDLLWGGHLQNQQDWLNRNPFRSTSLYAAPGEGFAEADILFSLEERYPLRAYLGYENTGTPSVGRNRWFAGLNWGDGFGRDQLISYQFTVGDTLSEFQAHSALWEIPLHRRHHYLRFGGAWAEVSSTSRDGGGAVDADGITWQASALYGVQLPRWHGFAQEFSVGGEFKTSDNFLLFGGVSPSGSVVDVVQVRIDYLATRQSEHDALRLSASVVVSPGGLSSHNEEDDFEAFRAGAQADYLYGRVKGTWLRRLPEAWSLRFAGQAQWADGKLLPIEQFALGGRDSVRGYEERLYLADSGYFVSTELRTPVLHLLGEALSATQLQVLGFLDHGIGWLDGGGNKAFTGIGAGIRLQAGRWGDLRFDVGWPLDGGDGAQANVGYLLSF